MMKLKEMQDFFNIYKAINVKETVSDFIFWAPKSLQMVTAATKLKDACSLGEKL